MLAATRHTTPKGLVAHMALQAGLRWAKHPPSFPVIVMTRNARLAELQLTLSWKTLDRLRTPFDKIWTNEIAAVLDKAGKAVGAAFNPSDLGTMQEAIDEAFDVLPFLYNRMYNQVAEVFAVRAGTAARRLMGQEQRADVFDETAESRRWISQQTGSRIAQVSANTVKAVKKFVDRSFVEGLTTDQIARGLVDNGTFGRARAFRIARTEVVAASNAGNNFATRNVLPNERFQKVWLSSRDIRVRDTHFSADGQAVDLDAAFKLAGGQLRFPGDSTLGASASEIVNCRCTTTHKPKKGTVGRRRPQPRRVTRPRIVLDDAADIKPSSRALDSFDNDEFIKRDIADRAAEANLSPADYIAKVEKRANKFLKDANVFTRVDSDSLDQIISSKRLKSQFETNTSSAVFNQGRRADLEADLFSIAQNSDTRKRPIYGYLGNSDNGNIRGLFGNRTIDQYGDISIKFRKKVRARTTFTAGDSLSANKDNFTTLPSKMNDPSFRSFSYEDDLIDPLTAKVVDTTAAEYVEAQIQGGVAIADIDTVFFSNASDFTRFGTRLRSIGIKIGRM